MSGESIATASGEAKPEGFFGLVRFLILLVLVGLVALSIAGLASRLRDRPLDSQAWRTDLFGTATLPFGLELREAARPAGQTEVLSFRREGPGEGPDELLVIRFASPGEVDALFRSDSSEDLSMRLAQWEREKDTEWHAMLRRDDIAWGAWSTRQRVDRAFFKGGGWRDSIRVDLSRSGQPRVLFALWPAEVEASEAQLLEILALLVVPDVVPDAPAAEAGAR